MTVPGGSKTRHAHSKCQNTLWWPLQTSVHETKTANNLPNGDDGDDKIVVVVVVVAVVVAGVVVLLLLLLLLLLGTRRGKKKNRTRHARAAGSESAGRCSEFERR